MAIAEERRDAIRDTIAASFPDFVPQVPRIYKSKVKNAQEAHDAITVTDTAVSPEEVEGTATERKLYDLVWQSTVACQMTDAHFENVRILPRCIIFFLAQAEWVVSSWLLRNSMFVVSQNSRDRLPWN